MRLCLVTTNIWLCKVCIWNISYKDGISERVALSFITFSGPGGVQYNGDLARLNESHLYDIENYVWSPSSVTYFWAWLLKRIKYFGQIQRMLWVSESPGLGKTGRFNKHLPLQLERSSGTEELPPCVWTDCRMEWVEVDRGAAGRNGGSGIPDTEQQSTWVTSHASFRPITNLTGKKEEGGSRDREAREGHREPTGLKKKEAAWWELRGRAREREIKAEKEGGRVRG